MYKKIKNTKTFLYDRISEKEPGTAKEYKNLCELCYYKLRNDKEIINIFILSLIGFGLELIIFLSFMSKGDYYTSTHAVPIAGIVGGFVYGTLNCVYGSIKIKSQKPYSANKTLIISYILFTLIAIIAFVIASNIDFNTDSIRNYDILDKYYYIRADKSLANIILRITSMLIILSIIILICYLTKYHAVRKIRLNYYNIQIFPIENLVIMEYKQSTKTEDIINLGNLKNWNGIIS